MNQPHEKYARAAARVLTEHCTDDAFAQPEARPDARRDAVVAAMALAIAERVRRRRILRGTVIGLAAAASIALAVGLSSRLIFPAKSAGVALFVEHETGKGNLLVRAGAAQPLLDLAALAAGDTVRSDELGGATLATGNGTRVTLAGGSHLRVDDVGATRRFALLAGQVDARVAKLGQGERFIVNTPDAEIEVRGTAFTVAVDGTQTRCRGQGAISSVKVREGAVWVRFAGEQVMLAPGQSWSAPCAAADADGAAAPAAVPATALSAPVGAVHPASHRPASTRAGSAPRRDESATASRDRPAPAEGPGLSLPTSHLAEQNDLFSSAMAADRQGRPDLALSRLEELIRRYPDGPLGESARVERARLLAAQSPH